MIGRINGTRRTEKDKQEQKQKPKAERGKKVDFSQVLDKEAQKENSKAP